jgi:ectoine hydroxylase-related dioxygenase (phytanoyl-CoA dioxygenase family)
VLFFNYLTIHGSGPNRSDRTRKTVLVQARDPLDEPTEDVHRSNAQGMMLRGINPNADRVIKLRRELAEAR